MKYRIDKQDLLDRITIWDSFLKRDVHLIACGGTALTLLGIKDSTKDVDLDDCLSLIRSKKKEINLKQLKRRFQETASFDVSEDKVNKNLGYFLRILKEEGFNDKQ